MPAIGATLLSLVLAVAPACSKSAQFTGPNPHSNSSDSAAGGIGDGASGPSLPLIQVADVPLPGRAVRFDYQDVDVARGHLVITHMNDASVVVVNLSDGSVVKVLPNIPTARGVVVADDVGRIFITSSPNQVVIVDNDSLAEIDRVSVGTGPDGIGWDPTDKIVGVSDQGDGAISLVSDSGSGARKQLALGSETGNVVFDSGRGRFWITAVQSLPPDQLIAIDPVAAKVTVKIDLPGCSSAHGLRIHPDGNSALVACEGNSKIVRVALDGNHALDIADSGADPDVLAIDPGLGWLYVAAESGDLKVFDLGQPGLTAIDSEHPGDASHSVAVDPATHRVFFPLVAGPGSKPVLRIMRPAGT